MNSRVSLKHLNNKLDNCADTLPWRQPTEPDHKGRFFDDPNAYQGRGCEPEFPPMDRKTLFWAVVIVALCLIPSFFWPQGFAVF